jgi:hypothetical protein
MATEIRGEWVCTAEEYHADHSKIGHTMLDDFIESPKDYCARYIAKTKPRKEPTGSMKVGTAGHILLWEPQNWGELVAPIAPDLAPDGKKWLRRKGSDHERWWAEFVAGCAGKLVLTQDQMEEARAAIAALRANETAMTLLSMDGPTEHAVAWQDKETRLDCKARFDKVAPGDEFDFLIDLKVTPDVSPAKFSRKMATMGYERQASWYSDGYRAVTGREPRFIFLAISPETGEVGIYAPKQAAIALGRLQNQKGLNDLLVCMESGDWSAEYEDGIYDLDLPVWKYSNHYEASE